MSFLRIQKKEMKQKSQKKRANFLCKKKIVVLFEKASARSLESVNMSREGRNEGKSKVFNCMYMPKHQEEGGGPCDSHIFALALFSSFLSLSLSSLSRA